MNKLEEITELVKNQSKAIAESGEECIPVIFALTPTAVGIISMEITEDVKAIFKPAIAKLLQQLNAYAYVMVNEAWGTALSPDSPIIDDLITGKRQVSELPADDRQEMLLITVVENGKSCQGWIANIRYSHDDRRCLDNWKEMQGVGEGRMTLKEW